jgi:similar to stage IV sporulation protein
MKNFWTHRIKGYLQIKVHGLRAEQFVNACARNNITIWNIRRLGSKAICCYIALEDIFKIRPLVRQADCRVIILRKLGAPFLYRRLKRRSGFAAGLLAFIFLMFIFSNVIWNIEIKGASPEINHQINEALYDMGVKRGKFQFVVPSPEKVQQALMERVDGVTWIGVRLNGTTYHFHVVEKTIPKEEEEYGPRHLVSSKKAIIYDYFVEEGKSLVALNDYVKEGQILISGMLGQEGNTHIVSAKGKVFGLVWYTTEVTIPLNSSFPVLTGNEKKTHSIGIRSMKLPIWGFGKPDYQLYETYEDKRVFHFLNYKLPIYYVSNTAKEMEKVIRKYSEEEAIEAGAKMAREDLFKKIPPGSKIKAEKILRRTNDNGKVKLLLHFTVVEEISKSQPIIQGD